MAVVVRRQLWGGRVVIMIPIYGERIVAVAAAVERWPYIEV